MHFLQVVGALINSTFLLAISVSIFVEAVGKFFIPPELITHPDLVLAIGGGMFSTYSSIRSILSVTIIIVFIGDKMFTMGTQWQG